MKSWLYFKFNFVFDPYGLIPSKKNEIIIFISVTSLHITLKGLEIDVSILLKFDWLELFYLHASIAKSVTEFWQRHTHTQLPLLI